MLKLVKAKKYQLKTLTNKVQNFTRMAASISGHPVQKTIAIHFHPCTPILLPQNTCSILFLVFFFFIQFIYLFGGIWQYNAVPWWGKIIGGGGGDTTNAEGASFLEF